MRRSARSWISALAASAIAGGAGCTGTTTPAGLEVIVTTDLTPATYRAPLQVSVEQQQQTATGFLSLVMNQPLAGNLPARFAIAPGSSPDQNVRITVTANDATGTAVATRVELAQVPRNYVAELTINLSASQAACPGTFTPAMNGLPAVCTVDTRDAGMLAAYVPDAAPPLPDATLPVPDATPDATPDGAIDATLDARVDASSDATFDALADAGDAGDAVTGVCTPGTGQCAGQQPQVCSSAGVWTNTTACPNGVGCVGAGSCQGVCTPGATQAAACGKCGTQTRTCVDGAWVDGSCAVPVGAVCTPNTTQACGNGTQTCTSSCGWGACSCPAAAVCTPGLTQCATLGVASETCDACGQWVQTTCLGASGASLGCANGTCYGVCVGTSECGANNAIFPCSGKWSTSGTPCAVGTCTYDAVNMVATCSGVCAPGATMTCGGACNPTTVGCDATGQYGACPTPLAANACGGCSTLAGTPTSACGPCMAYGCYGTDAVTCTSTCTTGQVCCADGTTCTTLGKCP